MNHYGKDKACPQCRKIKPIESFVVTWNKCYRREICEDCATKAEEPKDQERLAA